MLRYRRIYTLFACLGLFFGLVVPFSENTLAEEGGFSSTVFADVPEDSWYSTYVKYLYDRGIVKGMTDTEFVPYENVTVAEAAALVTRYLGLEEEAIKRKEAMELLGVDGSDMWYSGYIQLMHEAGIMDVTLYGCSVTGESVSIDEPEFLAAPVKRYEFSSFIARSFELDGTGINTANGTNGSEFIRGGSYDESIFENIIPFIKDYHKIPAEYSYYVLKNYYNGIFNGDESGNFNPEQNLTRAEMAKVITVVTDMSQRSTSDMYTESDTEVFDGYALPDEAYVDFNGVKYLKSDISDSILEGEVMSCISVEYVDGGIALTYKPSNYYPLGLGLKLRVYRTSDSLFYNEEEQLLIDGAYTTILKKDDICLFVLYDRKTGESIDAYEIMLNKYGLTENSNCNYLS